MCIVGCYKDYFCFIGVLKRVLPYPDAMPMGEDLHIYDMDIDDDDLVISHGSHIYSARINVSEE